MRGEHHHTSIGWAIEDNGSSMHLEGIECPGDRDKPPQHDACANGERDGGDWFPPRSATTRIRHVRLTQEGIRGHGSGDLMPSMRASGRGRQ